MVDCVAEVDSRCRRLIVPLFRGSCRFESLILSHHSRFTCACNKEEMNDDADQLCTTTMIKWIRTSRSIKNSLCVPRRVPTSPLRTLAVGLPWREAGPPNHHDDKVDSDQ